MMRILHGDVMSFCRHYRGPKFHALLCDPPYSLGFMGKDWDHDIAFHPETWAALAEHLHPGAFGMAFGSAKGWHRLAVAIEDAGLQIHPSIFGWSFGSGFPKATRIDTQIDAAAGAERGVVGKKTGRAASPVQDIRGGSYAGGHGVNSGIDCSAITAPATDLARTWEGHRYGRQALKPALEPIIVFQVPYKGKPVESIVKTGAGALNIDGGRIASELSEGRTRHGGGVPGAGTSFELLDSHGEMPSGRWPANFYLDAEGARRLGEQSGERESRPVKPYVRSSDRYYSGAWPDSHGGGFSDTGTAARFFFNVNCQLDEADPVLYCAKASRKERDAGLDCGDGRGLKAHPTMGSGIGGQPNQLMVNNRNHHPTVKPIDLARWLATLLLPPAEYAPRRILVPFSGSGSEMIGAHLAGWEQIIGIENEAEYVEIARARTDYWARRPVQLELIA
ncbi:MAG: hypothetical protein KAY24_06880 [Candidatus Eisenbacteria sp.]|nr:hypothetical protein [Candidatus Eisenbacteria bacterium]